MLSSRLSYGFIWPPGDIEHWNEPITAWIGAIYWAPNHIASLIACLVGLMLYYHLPGRRLSNQIQMMAIAGLAFASATGLSIWVTATFVVCWGIIILVNLFRKNFKLASLMILPGIIALFSASPFLLGLFQGNGPQTTFPVAFHIRPFGPIHPYLVGASPLIASLVYLFCLPINYFIELGLFSLVGLIWLGYYRRQSHQNNVIYEAERILIFVVLFIGSFVRSTAIQANDLGWRCWLFGQFILLIWTIDLIQALSKENLGDILPGKIRPMLQRLRKPLVILAAIGLLTTALDLSLLRTFPQLVDLNIAGFPNNGLSPDTKLGQRTLAAREAYNYIRDNLPENAIVQSNPTRKIDRPGGLYGSRQMAISDLSAYGIPEAEFNWRAREIGTIFNTSQTTWELIDSLCLRYSINVLILNDIDPAWNSLVPLEQSRSPLYENSFYTLFSCGNLGSSRSTSGY